jgi:hypothetical protein
MAKIIVTEIFPKGEGFLTRKRLIDTNSKIKENGSYPSVDTPDGEHFLVVESIEEICKLINEAEAQATNKKLDEILKNQVTIIKKLEYLHDDMRFISEEVESLT